MFLEAVAVIGILAIAASGFLLGQLLLERRLHRESMELRDKSDRRHEVILSNWASERELLRLAAETERTLYRSDIEKLLIKNQMLLDQAAQEREGLISRIQAWSPSPGPTPTEEKTEGSHISEEQQEAASVAELEKLHAERFDATLDGDSIVDMDNGEMFETLEEARAWRKYKADNDLPPNARYRDFMANRT